MNHVIKEIGICGLRNILDDFMHEKLKLNEIANAINVGFVCKMTHNIMQLKIEKQDDFV